MPLTMSDEAFLAVWERLRSAAKVAKETGIGERAVHLRRRKLEKKYGRPLTSLHERGDGKALITFEHYRGRIIHKIDSGTVIAFSDAHFWPGDNSTAYRGLLHVCKELRPQVVVCNGDAFDGSSISRFPRIGYDQTPTVKQEMDACDAALTAIEDASKGAKFYWPLGNHDARFEIRVANSIPEYGGVSGFTLKEHFPRWTPCWSVWMNEDTVIKHRYKGGIHAPWNNTISAGKNIVCGHLHSLKVYPLTDYNGDRFGVDTGTLSDIYGPKFEQ